MKLPPAMKSFWSKEDGVSSIEYALILALVGMGIIGAAAALGDQVAVSINTAVAELQY